MRLLRLLLVISSKAYRGTFPHGSALNKLHPGAKRVVPPAFAAAKRFTKSATEPHGFVGESSGRSSRSAKISSMRDRRLSDRRCTRTTHLKGSECGFAQRRSTAPTRQHRGSSTCLLCSARQSAGLDRAPWSCRRRDTATPRRYMALARYSVPFLSWSLPQSSSSRAMSSRK